MELRRRTGSPPAASGEIPMASRAGVTGAGLGKFSGAEAELRQGLARARMQRCGESTAEQSALHRRWRGGGGSRVWRRRRCGEMRAQRGLQRQLKEARDPGRACPLRVRRNPGEDRRFDVARPVEKAALACGPAGRGRARVVHEQ